MKSTKKLLTPLPKRVFTEAFKRTRVEEFEKGQFTVAEIADMYQVSKFSVYKWISLYSRAPKPGIRVIDMADSPDLKFKQLKDRIAELERMVGRKEIQLDFLFKMIDMAEEMYGIDIKKKFGNEPSSGSAKTERP
jgi:transposase